MFSLFYRSFASSVVNSALATKIFTVPFVRKLNSTVSFVAGQPLGYYSSWALFSLTNHILVWWCAEEVYPGSVFKDYAILGDDVVIANTAVAEKYEQALSRIGVSKSYQKSLISDTGCAEFAKKFRVAGLYKDFSPLSLKNQLSSHHPYGLMGVHNTYTIKRLSTLARVGGAGYRQLARFDHQRSKHFMRVVAMYHKTLLPADLWLGRGCPLNPDLRGKIIDFLRKGMAPRDLKIRPYDLFNQPGMKDFLEWSCLRAWVKQWLKYIKWYYSLALSPCVTIQDFFEAPVINHNWKLTKANPDFIRFGLIWKVYDMVALLGPDFKVPILEPLKSDINYPYLMGGTSGTQFLVCSEGLIQPSAARGVVFPGLTIQDSATPLSTIKVYNRNRIRG